LYRYFVADVGLFMVDKGFMFDPYTGYYFNELMGFTYIPNLNLYWNASNSFYYYYDETKQNYVKCGEYQIFLRLNVSVSNVLKKKVVIVFLIFIHKRKLLSDAEKK